MSTLTDEPARVWSDYCGTALLDFNDPALTFQMRLGRCYELAASAIVSGDLTDGILVHGSMRCENGESPRMGHAWVLLEDELFVWEPITGACYKRKDWYAWADARVERRYTPEEMRVQMLVHGHYGRWHDSEWP